MTNRPWAPEHATVSVSWRDVGAGFVGVAENVFLPRRYTVTVDDHPDVECTVQVWVDDGGALHCRRLELVSRGEADISTAVVRMFPVADLMRRSAYFAARTQREDRDGTIVYSLVRPGDHGDVARIVQTARRGQKVTEETLRRVADLYRASIDSGEINHTLSVELNVSKATAARYVAKARLAGFLGPTTRGKKGESP